MAKWNNKHQEEADKRFSGLKSPLIFYSEDKPVRINPMYLEDESINDNKRFIIMKTTENGRYIIGDQLCFRVNGVEIYTELDNAIFVDLSNNVVFIKEYRKVLEEISPVDPESRQYVIIMTSSDDSEDNYFWESTIGRMSCYELIVDALESQGIDPDKSFVLTENVALKDALSVTQFILYLQNSDIVSPEELDIEYYRLGE